MRIGVTVVALGTLLLLTTAKAPAATVLNPGESVTLAQLLNGDDVIVGDKLFYDFGLIANVAVNAPPINLANIVVTGIYAPDIGLDFAGLISATAGQMKDLAFDFNVRVLGSRLIKDNTLSFTAFAVSGDDSAFAGIAEDVFTDASEQVKLADKGVWTNGTSHFLDHVTYALLDNDVHVNKDINVTGGTGTAFISDFKQTFSQVPLPAAAWAGMALLGLLGAARIRKAMR